MQIVRWPGKIGIGLQQNEIVVPVKAIARCSAREWSEEKTAPLERFRDRPLSRCRSGPRIELDLNAPAGVARGFHAKSGLPQHHSPAAAPGQFSSAVQEERPPGRQGGTIVRQKQQRDSSLLRGPDRGLHPPHLFYFRRVGISITVWSRSVLVGVVAVRSLDGEGGVRETPSQRRQRGRSS